MNEKLTIKQFGEHAILINWPAVIDTKTHEEVLQMDAFISASFADSIIETVPTYHSLALYTKKDVVISDLIEKIKTTKLPPSRRKSKLKNILTIPVCYLDPFAVDIDEMAIAHSCDPSDIIQLHTKPLYKVYFIGFLPGFPYLGGLDKKLWTARKAIPRKLIESGSVAIGGSQTGIYAVDSPGGWNIIGRSPLQFFSTEKSTSSLLKAGDYVRFTAITVEEYHSIENQVAKGSFKIQKEVQHD